MTFDMTITPETPQYIVYRDHAEAPGLYSVRYFDSSKISGVQVAAHEKIEAVRQRIPLTHERAPFDQEAPMVEVWVLKKFIDSPSPEVRERYPRGWHPDRDY